MLISVKLLQNSVESLIFTYQVPLYVIVAGGLKGIRYVVNEVLVNPIATDSFGLSERDMTYFFIIYILGAFVGMILL